LFRDGARRVDCGAAGTTGWLFARKFPGEANLHIGDMCGGAFVFRADEPG